MLHDGTCEPCSRIVIGRTANTHDNCRFCYEDPRVGARRRRAGIPLGVLGPVDCGTQDGVVRGR
ncbi:hypothetical protein C8Q74DRAFT_1264432 [Fomes fomentarius]|nr:hypothetical protein C8Q74DRAFT_1264432 [Fomes fomentarius]